MIQYNCDCGHWDYDRFQKGHHCDCHHGHHKPCEPHRPPRYNPEMIKAMFERALFDGVISIQNDYTLGELYNVYTNWRLENELPDLSIPFSELDAIAKTYLQYRGEKESFDSNGVNVRSQWAVRWNVKEQEYIRLAEYVSEWSIFQATDGKAADGTNLVAGSATHTVKIGKVVASNGSSSDVTVTYRYAETIKGVRFYTKQ